MRDARPVEPRRGRCPRSSATPALFFDPTDVPGMAGGASGRLLGDPRPPRQPGGARRLGVAAVHLGRRRPTACWRASTGCAEFDSDRRWRVGGMKFCMLTTFFGDAQLRRRRRVRRPALAGPGAARARGPRHPLPRRLRDRRAATRPRGPTSRPPGVVIHPLESRAGPLSPLATHQTGQPCFKARAIRRLLAAIRPDVRPLPQPLADRRPRPARDAGARRRSSS